MGIAEQFPGLQYEFGCGCDGAVPDQRIVPRDSAKARGVGAESLDFDFNLTVGCAVLDPLATLALLCGFHLAAYAHQLRYEAPR